MSPLQGVDSTFVPLTSRLLYGGPRPVGGTGLSWDLEEGNLHPGPLQRNSGKQQGSLLRKFLTFPVEKT